MKNAEKLIKYLFVVELLCACVEIVAFILSGFQKFLAITIIMSMMCISFTYIVYREIKKK